MVTKRKLSEREYECSSDIIGGSHFETISATSKTDALKKYLSKLKQIGLTVDKKSIKLTEVNYLG